VPPPLDGSGDLFASNDVKALLSGTDYNPTLATAGQFTALSATAGTFTTLAISGFDSVTRLWITSSASVSFDNIVLDAAMAVPAPTALVLMGAGLLAAVLTCRRVQV
jgi:hypothetical protein